MFFIITIFFFTGLFITLAVKVWKSRNIKQKYTNIKKYDIIKKIYSKLNIMSTNECKKTFKRKTNYIIQGEITWTNI